MTKFLLYFFSIILLLALNIVFPTIRSSTPNFLFLFVVVNAFRKNNQDFLWLAFFSGLMLDIYSNVFFGTYTLSFMIIAVIISYTTKIFFSADPSIVYFGSVAAVSNLLLIGLVFIMNTVGVHIQSNLGRIPALYLGQKIWIDLFLNLIFVGPIYYLSSVIERIIEDNAKRSARTF
ncbi:MAG: rod shape-determining protein MreD [Candidatus Doudnabacteria bacterium]|nr:rod shape-determining protein MreD [Candidatus Doudnabacteria bacterium]